MTLSNGQKLFIGTTGIRFGNLGNQDHTFVLYADYRAGTFKLIRRHTASPWILEDWQLSLDTSTVPDYPFFEPTSSPTYILLYKVLKNRVNTEALYDAIQEASAYLDDTDGYIQDAYQQFVADLQECVQLYGLRNGENVTNAATVQAEIDAKVQALLEDITEISYANRIAALPIPYTEYFPVTSDIAEPDLEGKWFVLAKTMNDLYYKYDLVDNYTYWAMDRNDLSGGTLGAKNISVVNGTEVSASSLDYTVDLINYYYNTTDKNRYTVLLDETSFLAPTSATEITLGKPNVDYVVGQNSAGNGSVSFRKNWGSAYYLTYLDGKFTFGTSEAAGELLLFRVSPATLELYQAFQYVKRYAHADGQYPEEVYDEFIACLEACLGLYQQYNCDQSDETLAMKGTLDDKAAELRGYADDLTKTVGSFIDIPIEVLDFRSDTFLFEFATKYNRYQLMGLKDATSQNIPGYLYKDPTGMLARVGLVCEDLIDGQMIYKEETVAYLAQLLLTDNTPDEVAENLELFADVEDMTDFRTLIGSLIALNATDPQKALGSFADTLSETIPNKHGEQINGCVLPWKQVNTAYDLAYYALNNLWRSVPTTDALNDGSTYNIIVPERDRIRMYQDESGLYTIDSDYDVIYDGHYIYNSVPQIPIATAMYGTPKFTPINGLGYEKNNRETDTGSYWASNGYEQMNNGANYHYTIHAYGSFVYYSDQDLYFKFEGDDDVYFFINGHSALQLGGCHSPVYGELELNSIAAEYGLVDGNVYSFDMFYAERHTTGSNLRFSTNMSIAETDTLTTKGQYVEISGDDNLVHDATGMGDELEDNGHVKVGDTVAYSFDVVNSHNMPIFNLVFEDKTLGAYLSKNGVTLCNEGENAATTDISDIEVYYRTSAREGNTITVDESDPVRKSLSEIKAMIEEANAAAAVTPGSGIPKGSYRVTMTSTQDLMDLMALGVPANCKIVVYGFKRPIVEADQKKTITNTMTMSCSYLPWSSADTEENVKTLSGTSTRILKVSGLSGVPVANKVEYAMDFSKPLKISTYGLVDAPADVTLTGFVGLIAKGHNGKLLKDKPTDLADELEATYGTFVVKGEEVIYTLNAMLDLPEKVYAVFAIDGCTITDDDGKARNYPYILVEIAIVPATSVYYETGMLEDHITTTVKGETDWGVKNDYIKDIHNGFGIDNNTSFFFGFDNRPEDRERYSRNAYYGGFNYDVANWVSHYTTGTTGDAGNYAQDYTIDNEKGILSLMVGFGYNADGDEYNEMYGPEIYTTAETGKYHMANPSLTYTAPTDGVQRYVQVRFKTINCKFDPYNSYRTSPEMILRFGVDSEQENDYGYKLTDHAPIGSRVEFDVQNGEFLTLTAPITEEFAGLIRYVGVRFRNIVPADGTVGAVEVDYIYIGTEDGLPTQNKTQQAGIGSEDILYFDFANSEMDRVRYSGVQYQGNMFDAQEAAHWTTRYVYGDTTSYGSDYAIDNENGTMTVAVGNGNSISGSSLHFGTEFYTTVQANTNDWQTPALQYDPAKAEYLYVRFRTSNCKFDANGTGDSSPNFILRYTYQNEVGETYTEDTKVRQYFALANDEFITLEVPLNDTFKNAAKIGSIGLRFRSVTQASEEGGSITIDYIYIGPKVSEKYQWRTEIHQDALRIDFTESDIQVDTTTDLATRLDTTYAIDTQKGTLYGEASVYDPYIGIEKKSGSFNYKIQPGDVLKMRLRVAATTNKLDSKYHIARAYFLFDDMTRYYEEYAVPTKPILINGMYQVVTYEIPDSFVGKTLHKLRLDPLGNEAGARYNPAIPFEFDWIYIGPDTGDMQQHPRQEAQTATQPNKLRIEFTETDVQVDTASTASRVKNAKIASGALCGEISGGDPYIGVKKNSGSFNYKFQVGDVLRMRLKVNSNGNNIGEEIRKANLYLMLDNMTAYSDTYSLPMKPINLNGSYQVIAFEIPAAWAGKTLNKFRVDPLGNESKTYSRTMPFEIDWIYIGPDDSSPLYIFEDFDFEGITSSAENGNNGLAGEISYDMSGVVKGTINNVDPYFGFKNCEDGYQYKIQPDDVVKLRIKVNPSVDYTPERSQVQVFFGNMEKASITTGGISTLPAPFATDGEYHIVTLQIYPAAVGQTVKNLRIDPVLTSGNNPATLTDPSVDFEVDWIYVGPDTLATDEGVYYPEMAKLTDKQADEQMPYGYDATYIEDTYHSDSSSMVVEGVGVVNHAYVKDENGNFVLDADRNKLSRLNYASVENYTEATFTFTGTGFDIISRTGVQQGSLRAYVCDSEGFVRKTATVMNSGKSELYQIPVISVENLKHGTYTVHIFVNAAYTNSAYPGLNRGGEFYFDAIRVYNPINTAAGTEDAKTAYALYQKHGEADSKFTEVRQKLIDASKETSSETIEGVVYLDTKDGSTTQIAKYTEVGPNNEVYLAPDKAIAFKLEATGTIPASIDIGVKSVNGTPAIMSVSIAGVQTDIVIASGTALYYPLNIAPDQWQSVDGKNYVTVSISNSGAGGILSLTDVKYAYDAPAASTGESRSLRFLVDRDVLPPVEEKPTEDESLTFGAQLYLENDLTMAFRVKTDKLTAYDISTAYLVVERDVYESGAKEATVEAMTIGEYKIENGRLIFSYPGIAAAQMNDAIRATFYIKDANGQEYVSPVLNTSVATYLDGLLRGSASDTKLITLLMDMVNYGAAAQVYFDRHADAPVNEAYESFKTYASYASADFRTALENLSATENAEGKSGKLNLGLDLGTRIGIQYKVTVPTDVNVKDVTLVITDSNGNVLETLQVAGNPADDRGRFIVNFYGSTSRDMRRVVYATAYAKGEAITGTYAYSISTYAWGVQENAATQPENLVSVTRAMMLYGDSAEAYFG